MTEGSAQKIILRAIAAMHVKTTTAAGASRGVFAHAGAMAAVLTGKKTHGGWSRHGDGRTRCDESMSTFFAMTDDCETLPPPRAGRLETSRHLTCGIDLHKSRARVRRGFDQLVIGCRARWCGRGARACAR